ncbi:MAG: pseudouridine synthase [Chlamydiota bacterium]
MENKQRLSKVMAQAGLASRRHCEEIIFTGRVTVNGEVVLLPQTMVEKTDNIKVDGYPLPSIEKKVYYLLNKPPGYLCSNSSHRGEKIVIDLFEKCPYRLFTVGRLDKETTGLLIVTNDGHFAQRVIHPSADIEKEYLAEVNNPLSEKHLRLVRQGAKVEGSFVKPVEVKKVENTKVRIVVKEGKKREVRVLIKNAGLTVKHLSRIRIGQLSLKNLPEGKWRAMTEHEKQQIFA